MAEKVAGQTPLQRVVVLASPGSLLSTSLCLLFFTASHSHTAPAAPAAPRGASCVTCGGARSQYTAVLAKYSY